MKSTQFWEIIETSIQQKNTIDKSEQGDAILAILLSGSLAIAVIIVSLGGAFNNSLFSYLFGSILSVSDEDVITM